MMPVEQAKLVGVVNEVLASYSKAPTAAEIEAWWVSCRSFSLTDVERALREHQYNEEEGKRAPRPIDVKRRLQFGTRETSKCAASGPNGNCAYPGIFSDATTGGERWYCPWHREDHAGPEAERWIEVSQQVPYATALAKRSARMLEESQRSPGVKGTAREIADRRGNTPWPCAKLPVVLPPGAPIINEDAEEALDA